MLASFVCALALQGPAPLRLKVGDAIRVTIAQRVASVGSPFDGVYAVSDDGAIYGSGFGRIDVAGKPFADAERRIRIGLKPYIRPEFVYVRLEAQRGEAVFLVGGAHPGRMPLEPGLTLRKVLPQTDAADWDLQEVELVRDGKRILRSSLGSVFRSQEAVLDAPLVAGDVVSVVPTESLRVWVAGDVARPGEMKMPRGATLGQVLAAAGGMTGGRLDRDRRIRLRRGTDEKSLAYDGGQVANDVPIEAGDLITVAGPAQLKLTVTGQASQPGEYVVEEGTTLATALAKAGGPSESGSLKNIMVLRKGEAIQIDASDPLGNQDNPASRVENGDLIVIPRNERRIYVLGEVGHGGAFAMQEDRVYRLADAVSMAGGLGARGVFRRITVVRAGADGRSKPVQYNLDEYLKDGKIASNPVLQPGDAVYVGTSKGITLGTIASAVGGVILLESLGGGR